MEKPSASECTTADRCDSDRESLRNGIRLDGKWKYQQLRGSPPARGPVWACGFSVEILIVLISSAIIFSAGRCRSRVDLHS